MLLRLLALVRWRPLVASGDVAVRRGHIELLAMSLQSGATS